MEPEAEHVALRERLSRLVFRTEASLLSKSSGISPDDRIRLTLKREEAADLKGALNKAKEEIRRLKSSMVYPSPVTLAEEAVKIRRRKLRQATSECNQLRLLLAPFMNITPRVSAANDSQRKLWQGRLVDLRREQDQLKQRLRKIEDIVRDKHANVIEKERKSRDQQVTDIDKLKRQIRFLKASEVSADLTPL